MLAKQYSHASVEVLEAPKVEAVEVLAAVDASQVFCCEWGCGFNGAYDTVEGHEVGCSRRPAAQEPVEVAVCQNDLDRMVHNKFIPINEIEMGGKDYVWNEATGDLYDKAIFESTGKLKKVGEYIDDDDDSDTDEHVQSPSCSKCKKADATFTKFKNGKTRKTCDSCTRKRGIARSKKLRQEQEQREFEKANDQLLAHLGGGSSGAYNSNS